LAQVWFHKETFLNEAAMARPLIVVIVSAAIATCVADTAVSAAAVEAAEKQALDAQANPIRRVVNLLQGLSRKITTEGEREAKLYQEAMCYCKTNRADLAKAIVANDDKVPQIQSELSESESKLQQVKSDLRAAKKDKAEAEEAMEAATQQRKTENMQFAAEVSDIKSMIAPLATAIPAIEKGLAGNFLQKALPKGFETPLLDAAASSMDLNELDKRDVTAFLSGSMTGTPQGASIAGILKTMKAEAERNLAASESEEADQVKTYEALMAAKNKQSKGLVASIQVKVEKVGELAVAVANMKKDLAEILPAIAADKKTAADLERTCAAKAANTQEREKTRGEELVAVQDTIKILNDDSALDLFKKALPSASLLQVENSASLQRQHALTIIRASGNWAKADLDLLETSLRGGKQNLSKVLEMIDNMQKLLVQEQTDDDNKVEYCEKQLATSQERLQRFTKKVGYLGTSVDDKKELMASVDADMKMITSSINKLDKSVKVATAQRKDEHEEYAELVSSNDAAKALLNVAIDRMNTFYNPTEHPKKGAGFIVLPAWHGTAFLQEHSTSSETGNKVISMLDHLIKGLDKEIMEADAEERYSQKDYEGMLEDSVERRSASTKSLTVKESVKADCEEDLLAVHKSLKSKREQRKDAANFKKQLHAECDWIMSNHGLREKARNENAEGLKNAKAVLHGANYR